MKWLLLTIATLAAAALAAQRYNASQDTPDEAPTEPDQLTTWIDDIVINTSPSTYAQAPTSAPANEAAFLSMIAWAEGTDRFHGYATAFGGGLIPSLHDHPRKFYSFTNSRGEKLRTSAAGRYQFLVKTWDTLAARLGLPDFGPDSQDRAALELIRERGALGDVRAGRTAQAIEKVAKIWASLPGAGYAQPEKKLTALLTQYRASGGTFEA